MKHFKPCILLARYGAGLAVTAMSLAWLQTATAATCEARSPLTAVPVVELYTSQGCSSCPPADRWISQLRDQPQAVALAFHVGYWDYLGWKDRFAQAQFNQRQREQLAVNGARGPYTPQVVVNGRDMPQWELAPATSLLSTANKPAPVTLQLQREGAAYQAQVLGLSAASARLSAFWAVTEGPQQTAVKAGENKGETLLDDFIVRELVPVATWSTAPGHQQVLNFTPSTVKLDTSLARHVNLVVLDAQTGRPVQAIKVGC
jgi:hypothetical protein